MFGLRRLVVVADIYHFLEGARNAMLQPASVRPLVPIAP